MVWHLIKCLKYNRVRSCSYLLNGELYAVKIARTVRIETFGREAGCQLYFLVILKFIFVRRLIV